MNAFKSQKDVFDWDLNTLNSYNTNKNKNIKKNYGKQMIEKNLYSSKCFSGEEEVKKPSRVKIYRGYSDIFNTKHCDTVPTKISIHRQNRNAESNINENTYVDKPRRKLNLQQQQSKENPFCPQH